MGTVVSFLVEAGASGGREELAAIERACSELDRLDAMFSTFKPESAVSRLRRFEAAEPPPGGEPAELAEVLALCAELRRSTGGLFDPWAMPGGLDPSGLVKGWAVERAAAIVEGSGAPAGLVNGGGDVATFGRPAEGAWLVGVRHPWRPEALACVVALEGGEALATSGSYERGRHIVDPVGGERRRQVVSASVSGHSLALSDALATALAVGSAEGLGLLSGFEGYEGYLVLSGGEEELSEGFPLAPGAGEVVA